MSFAWKPLDKEYEREYYVNIAWESYKIGGILGYVGGWTSRCCGSGSGESIGEKRVDEGGVTFHCLLLIIEFEKLVYSTWRVAIIEI